MRLLITRPEEDAGPLAEALRALGHEALRAPVMTMVEEANTPLALDGVQALLATSAHGVRAFARRSVLRTLALYAVGDGTARAAREAGFSSVVSAGGDVEDLARVVAAALDPAGGALLHVAGSVTAGDLGGLLTGRGFGYRRAVLYRAEPVAALNAAAAAALKAGTLDGVLLFSPRTARLFVGLARELGPPMLQGLTAYCLSQAVAAEAASGGFGRVVAAPRPDQASLLGCLAPAEKA